MGFIRYRPELMLLMFIIDSVYLYQPYAPLCVILSFFSMLLDPPMCHILRKFSGLIFFSLLSDGPFKVSTN